MNENLVIAIGFALRIALPIVVTLIVVAYLRSMDAKWQAEARAKQVKKHSAQDHKLSYAYKGCSKEQTPNSEAMEFDEPCWQIKRMQSGYLSEQCLSCEVFRNAPVPAHHHI